MTWSRTRTALTWCRTRTALARGRTTGRGRARSTRCRTWNRTLGRRGRIRVVADARGLRTWLRSAWTSRCRRSGRCCSRGCCWGCRCSRNRSGRCRLGTCRRRLELRRCRGGCRRRRVDGCLDYGRCRRCRGSCCRSGSSRWLRGSSGLGTRARTAGLGTRRGGRCGRCRRGLCGRATVCGCFRGCERFTNPSCDRCFDRRRR